MKKVVEGIFLSRVVYENRSLIVVSLENSVNNFNCDLFDGMPPNSIINTSVNLYRQEIDEVL